jgi:hypothetical protein
MRVACTEIKRFTDTGQAGTMMAQERLSKVEHAAVVTQKSGLYKKQTFYINWTGWYNG